MNFIKILRNSLYSKYKSGVTNYYISKTNSILFKQNQGSSKQFLGNYLKEMYMHYDDTEFIQKYFYIDDSNFKLKVLGYIYFHNFKYPPNYLNLDNGVLNIMCKLLKEKQNLIDRNIATNCLVYEKSRNKYNYKYYKSGDKNIIFNDMNMNKSNSSFSIIKNQNVEKYSIFENKNKNYINKDFIFFTNLKEIKNKEKEINNNSTDSITKLVKKIKNVKINIINDINKNNINFIKNINSKDSINKLETTHLQSNKSKNKFTSPKKIIFNNKNNIRELVKSRNSNFNKINKSKLSVEDFKENLRKSKRSLVQKYLDNYWKENKNFIMNLIGNKNIINFNRNVLQKSFYSTNNSENINNFLSTKSMLSTRSNKSIKIKLKSNSFNKNKFPQGAKKAEFNNTLRKKIQYNSYFMKNKNFHCISNKENINSRNIFSVKAINYSYKHKPL